MRSDVSFIAGTEAMPPWQRDDELAHIEDTLRSEPLIFDFEHLSDDCSCSGKTCRKCHTKQCHLAFPPDKRKRDGLHSYCRPCRTIARAEHRRAHPERKCISNHNYRARQAQTLATLTTQQWFDLKEQYDHRCLCCGKQEPDVLLTLDHVIPLAQGGPSTIENAQVLCRGCNSGKKDRIIDYRPDSVSMPEVDPMCSCHEDKSLIADLAAKVEAGQITAEQATAIVRGTSR